MSGATLHRVPDDGGGDEEHRPDASLPSLRRLPGRREIAAFYLLSSAGTLEYGEALELLRVRLCLTKRTARRLLKRLRKLGLVSVEKRGEVLVVRSAPLEELVERVALNYIEYPRRRMGGDEEGCTLRPRPGV